MRSASSPSGTTIAAGGYYVIEQSVFVFGLGSPDSGRLFLPDGTTLIDSFSWTPHGAATYGRCPNGAGAFANTPITKGVANDCSGVTPTTTTTTTIPPGNLPWPGDPGVQPVDLTATFTRNLSGLTYEGSGSSTPGVLWAARNGVGALFRLVFNGTNWVPDTNNGWGAGKPVHYPSGLDEPDAEGVTMGGPTSADGLYVASERNNSANTVSRNSILRFDANAPGTSLTVTREWNLTADLPPNGANLGLEAITWIPDTFLVGKGFYDESKLRACNPAECPDHGVGLFFVGVEASGIIYAYALDHVGGGFTRIATISSGFVGVMALEFDRDLNDLWAVCDNTCAGRSAVLRIDSGSGKFVVSSVYERPASMPDINNEGFAIAPETECVGDRKPAFWADDSDTGGNSIRRGNLPCAGPPANVPDFPFAAMASIVSVALLGGWSLLVKRHATGAVARQPGRLS